MVSPCRGLETHLYWHTDHFAARRLKVKDFRVNCPRREGSYILSEPPINDDYLILVAVSRMEIEPEIVLDFLARVQNIHFSFFPAVVLVPQNRNRGHYTAPYSSYQIEFLLEFEVFVAPDQKELRTFSTIWSQPIDFLVQYGCLDA